MDQLIVKNSQIDMENTINLGAEVTVNKQTPITRNCIIAFELPNAKEPKLLRVMGLPGDQIEIRDGEMYINGMMNKKSFTSKRLYSVYLKDSSKFKDLTMYKFSPYSEHYSIFSLSSKEYERIVDMKIVDSIYLLQTDSTIVQTGIIYNDLFKHKNHYYYGPLKIPDRNSIIDENIATIVPNYLSRKDIGEKLNDNYFFCIGDNFPEARDSRFIGLIPQRSVLGVVERIDKNNSINVNSNR